MNIRPLITSVDGPRRGGQAMRQVRQDSPVRKPPHERRPYKVTSGTHSAQSSFGKLSCDDTVSLYSLSSHSFTQWGQLGEILGGVRVPEGGASRRSARSPTIREVVSNRIIKKNQNLKYGGSRTVHRKAISLRQKCGSRFIRTGSEKAVFIFRNLCYDENNI